MKGVIVHGVLLLAMLGVAWSAWTKDKSVKSTTGSVVVWNAKAGDITAFVHQSKDRTIRLERKDGYFWGTDTKITRKPKKKEPPATDAGVPETPPATPETHDTPEMEETTTVREFPVGKVVDELLAGLSSMRALRSLGQLTDEQKDEYKLKDADKTLTVVFADGKSRELVIGDKALGSKERYVLEVESGTGYLVAGTVIEPFDGGERALAPKDVIPVGDEVGSVELSAGDKTRKVSRISVTGENGKAVKTWGEGGKEDTTTANYLTKIETATKPTRYDATLDEKSLTPIVALTYRDAKGGEMEHVRFYKREKAADPVPPPADPAAPPPPAPAPTVEYFVVTDATRVPGMIPKTAGDQIEQQLADVLR